MGKRSDCTNFSCQQTHAEFKPNIGNDPFQHVSDQGPNDCEEETANDGDELWGRGRIEKEMKNGHEDDYPDLHRR
jgi:hypothetical protein